MIFAQIEVQYEERIRISLRVLDIYIYIYKYIFYLGVCNHFVRIKPSMRVKMEKFSAQLIAPRKLEQMKVSGVLCHVIKTFLLNKYRTRTWCNKVFLVMLMSHAY